MKRLLISLFLVFTGSLALADNVIKKSFDMNSGGLLVLKTDTGSISVDTHDDNQVSVEVEIDGLDDNEFEVSFAQDKDRLMVTGDKLSSSWGWGNQRVHFDIRVPKNFNLDLRTAGGSISVSDLTGQVEVATSGGSLNFGNIVGPVNGRTSGGSITVDGVEGDIEVKTSGGSLNLGDIKGDLKARTSGGSINLGTVSGSADVATSGGSIRIKEISGELEASTSGGSIEVTLSDSLKSSVDLSTSGGNITVRLDEKVSFTLNARGSRIKSDFPVNGETSAEYRLKGDVNGGGPKMTLKTANGTIYIKEK